MEWKNGVILDLSGGGVRFVSTFSETKGTVMEVRFEITIGEETEYMYSYGKLLRSEKNPNKNTLFDHRVEFWSLENEMREKIIRFIFEEQRRNRSRQLGNDV